ncbi:MAG: NADH-quinone oxidoreductase subunit NuoN [Rhodobacteraceae bacterium]|nr:NADH-quinone oxidoreductase subunit NuoN [Paracoccaceae bacterium]
MTANDFNTILPEFVLAAFALGALMFGAYGGKDKVAPTLVWATSGLFIALALFIGLTGTGDRTAFGGMMVDDAFARFAKVVILTAAAAILLMTQDYMQRWALLHFEWPVLVTLSVVGMCVMVSSGDLMALYMGLELQSLALYVLAAMRRDSAKSSEAGLKYFVLGALSSGLFLYGASLAYGFSGATGFAAILSTLGQGAPVGLIIGLVFMLSALAFKVSAAPFHMWTPDVYEGSPTPITALFATAPKVAAMCLIARLLHDAFGPIPGQWGQVLAALAVVSMFLGAIAAIGQRNIKRMMAYSSIAHMGYALVGLASGTAEGVQAMLIYMAIYVTMNVGTFSFILSMERDGKPISDIQSLNMFSKKEPLKALALLILMFSLAGVPPMLGFFGKFYVLKAAVDAGLVWLALAGAVASVIGAYYYLRIVFLIYFGKESEPADSTMAPVQWAVMVAVSAIMLFGIVNLFGIEPVAAVAAQALVQ